MSTNDKGFEKVEEVLIVAVEPNVPSHTNAGDISTTAEKCQSLLSFPRKHF